MEKLFKNKVVLVAGEVSELSTGIIHSFLKEMAIVIFPAKSLQQVEMVKSFSDIHQHKNFVTLLIDVHDFDKMMETCENITEKYGKIDVAIQIPQFSNCKKELTEASIDEWNNMMETDMMPFFMGARIVLNMMKGNLRGMFVHITDSKFFDNLTSCALGRIAFTTRMEMSKIFAEEAHRSGKRYYHLWAQNLSGKETSPEKISAEIMNLYQQETYNTETAFQSFPEQLRQQPV